MVDDGGKVRHHKHVIKFHPERKRQPRPTGATRNCSLHTRPPRQMTDKGASLFHGVRRYTWKDGICIAGYRGRGFSWLLFGMT